MQRNSSIHWPAKIAGILGFTMLAATMPSQAAWEPNKPVELVVPAGTGGGADQMAR